MPDSFYAGMGTAGSMLCGRQEGLQMTWSVLIAVEYTRREQATWRKNIFRITPAGDVLPPHIN